MPSGSCVKNLNSSYRVFCLMFKSLRKMKKTQKRQTKKGWGLVACIGAMVAVTMGDSITMAAIGTAMLALGAWLGGYMDASTGSATNQTTNPAAAGERRAA